MPRPKRNLSGFSKLELRKAIDRLKNSLSRKNYTNLAKQLGVDTNLLYAWRKEGIKEARVSPTTENAIKLGVFEKQLGLAGTEDVMSVCKRWLKLSARHQVSDKEIKSVLLNLNNLNEVRNLEWLVVNLNETDVSHLIKALALLKRKITVGDFHFILELEYNLGLLVKNYKLTHAPIIEHLLKEHYGEL